MSDNKGFETMRDLVRALQQAEYGLRTGELALEDLDKACHNANALHERLVVIRHKAREAHVREQAMQTAKAQAPKQEPTRSELPEADAPMPGPSKTETVKAEEPRAEMAKAEVLLAKPERTAPREGETPKTDVPKIEAAEAPKPELRKMEAHLAEELKPAPRPEPKAPKPELTAPVQEEATVAKAPLTVPTTDRGTHLMEKQQSESGTAIAETAEASGAKTAAEFLAAFRAGAAPKPTPTLAEKMEKARIDDLLKAISISDRFWFTKELFNGEKAAFEKAVSQMNAASSIEEASNLLSKAIIVNPKKPANPEAQATFMELLQRRFA